MSSATVNHAEQPSVLGHPPGLFLLFFAEMWERFSYYGMRALLTFYMIKGFLGYGDSQAYGVYGAYTALVYATPFIGGMLADRLLGERKAVVLGGLLMAAGHLLMTVESEPMFFTALALLIVGNGFFKPNISTVVGSLYPEGSPKRDSGFTLFYMGINLGAALAPLLCGMIGETFGWHYGFGLATGGMLVGLAVFVAPPAITRALIVGGAAVGTLTMLITGIIDLPGLSGVMDKAFSDENMGMFGRLSYIGYRLINGVKGDSGETVQLLFPDGWWIMATVNAPIAVALIVAAGIAVVAVSRGSLPAHVGLPPVPERLTQPALAPLGDKLQPYYLAIIAAGVVLAYAVPPYSLLGYTLASVGLFAIALPWLTAERAVYAGVVAAIPVFALIVQRDEIAGTALSVFGVIALGSIAREAFRSEKVERERLYVVLILMFFSMLFWAFFEQAGSSVNNFTDRNVDRVVLTDEITSADVGKTLDVRLTQEYLGRTLPGETEPLNITRLNQLQAEKADTVTWTITTAEVGLPLGGRELPASLFQATNPLFILIFGLVFSALWSALGRMGMEPSTPVKFAFGLLQLGLGFFCFWWGAYISDERGMVGMIWLVGGYLLHTTGELCLSPVGLSMVTRLSPGRIVSTVMGGWFLATAFSNVLGGFIAKLTGVHEEGGGAQQIPIPLETLPLYTNVFFQIGVISILSALFLLAISPFLKRWMHEQPGQAPTRGH